jgi:hypothetical protein
MRLIRRWAMRLSTKLRYASGSIPFSLAAPKLSTPDYRLG